MNTRTYATMEVSAEAFDEIRAKLESAGYEHAVHDKGEILDMHGIGLTRGESAMPVDGEKNPNHPVTTRMRTEWHKLTALMVAKHGATTIIADDVTNLRGQSIVVDSKDDGLYLYLVSDEEAARMARNAGGLPG